MLPAAPRPLPRAYPLRDLLDRAPLGSPLGAWVRGAAHPVRLRTRRAGRAVALLASGDLRFLLTRCASVAVRRGGELAVLGVDRLIGWRALQVAAALPCLPALEQLAALFPGVRVGPGGLTVPLGEHSAESVLAECVRGGIDVRASRVLRLE